MNTSEIREAVGPSRKGTTKSVVYIAGPYTNPDPVENVHNTCKFATELMQMTPLWVPFVPHLTMLWHAITPMPYETWLDVDLAHMANCDAVIRLPGASSGADAEIAYARTIILPVFHVTEINGGLNIAAAAEWLETA